MRMQIKDRFSVKIESVAFGGSGVGRKDGFVIFVPFTAPDEVVEIEIIQLKKKFARGRILNILTPSPFRTKPICRYFGICGGCSYQHIRYDQQLEIKRRQVAEAFMKIGGIAEPKVEAVIASPLTYAYRGKATLHAAREANRFTLGFMDVTGASIADIDRCEIMHESINDQIRDIRTAGTILSRREDITLWSDDPDQGNETVVRSVKGLEFLVPRSGFFQANLSLVDRMVDEVSCLLPLGDKATVIDACCGCGLFSVFIAPKVSRMIGIEINEKSVRFARINAGRQGLTNTEFVSGNIEDVLCDMARKADAVDAMILDPPRTGLSPEALAAIINLKMPDLIYISCNPATQARDVKAFCEAGYDLHHLQPLDMFAQTEHVETIGWLRRK
jgi:23S rRNA (uracil1939-C5)-methyltransferase